MSFPSVFTTALTEEQKLKVAGAGRWALRHRSTRCLRPAMLSFSKLLSWRLKLTDQAQWITSVTSEVNVLYSVGLSPRVDWDRSDGSATSLFRARSGRLS